MPQETKSKTPLEINDGLTHGARVEASDPEALRAAIEAAFHYRGDVTIERLGESAPGQAPGQTPGPAPIEGYIFDRSDHENMAQATLRILPSDGSERVSMTYAEVAALAFTGRDTAAGKSFDTWMKKYVQKKLAGHNASIESESLEEE